MSDESIAPESVGFQFSLIHRQHFDPSEIQVQPEPVNLNPLNYRELSPQARRAQRHMMEAAMYLNHSWLEPAHLLLGLLAEPDLIITQAFLQARIMPEELRVVTVAMLRPKEELQLTFVLLQPQLHQILLHARQEAESRRTLIGPEHLLLGLLAEPDPTIVQVFLQLRSSPEMLRAALETVLQGKEAPGEEC